MSDDLVAFLRARLDEDWDAALEGARYPGKDWDALPQDQKMRARDGVLWDQDHANITAWFDGNIEACVHAARHDPRRILREVEAKRAIVDDSLAQEHFLDDGEWYGCAAIAHHPAGQRTGRDCTCGRDEEVERRLRLMAAVYSDHPDYRQEWEL